MIVSTETRSNVPTIPAQVVQPIIVKASTTIITNTSNIRMVSSNRIEGSASLTYSPKEFLPETTTKA